MPAGRCLVLNASHEFINITPSWFDGVRLVAKGCARPLADYGLMARSERSGIPIPSVVVLNKYVRIGRRRPVFSFASKRNILVRDGFRCAYCRKPLTFGTCTKDHVFPTSRGGKDELTNVVSSCASCNHRKADKTPAEAGMELLAKPRHLTDEEKIGVLLKTHRAYEREAWIGALSSHGLTLF